MREIPMRGVHDIGGLAAGAIDRTEHVPAFWEKRVHAMMLLLNERQLVTVDELRRGIEALGETEYDRLRYYERWIVSLTNNLLHKGLLSSDELGRKLAEIEERQP